MKVHITLVGGQPAPVYHGIAITHPEKVVLIHSKDTYKEAQRLSKLFSISFELIKFEPVNLEEIEKKCNECFEKYKDDDLTINISSGTKPWTLYFYNTFSQLSNAKLFYIDQNNFKWNLSDKTREEIPFDMDILLKVQGNTLTDYKNLKEYTDEDNNVAAEMEKFRQFCFKHKLLDKLNSVTAVLSKSDAKRVQNVLSGMVVNKDNTACAKWDETGLVQVKVESHEMAFKSPHAKFLVFNSGWYEYKVAKMLSHSEKIKEIRLNCGFPIRDLEEGESANDNLKNEIDIIAATNSKLVFVECKAGDFHSTDIDKFSSAVEVYGGKGSKKLFVSGGWFSDVHFEKFNDLKITYSRTSHKAEKAQEDEKKLLARLDSVLSSINA